MSIKCMVTIAIVIIQIIRKGDVLIRIMRINNGIIMHYTHWLYTRYIYIKSDRLIKDWKWYY